MCIYIYVCIYIYIHTYIYIQRERVREREREICLRNLASGSGLRLVGHSVLDACFNHGKLPGATWESPRHFPKGPCMSEVPIS